MNAPGDFGRFADLTKRLWRSQAFRFPRPCRVLVDTWPLSVQGPNSWGFAPRWYRAGLRPLEARLHTFVNADLSRWSGGYGVEGGYGFGWELNGGGGEVLAEVGAG